MRKLVWYFINKIFFNYDNPKYYHWAYVFSERYVNFYRGDDIGGRERSGEWRFLKEYISKEQPKIIFDVGANDGVYTKQMREAGSDAIIHAFEPVSSTYRDLYNNVKDDRRVIPVNVGLSDKSGAATIHICSDDNVISGLHDDSGSKISNYDRSEEVVLTTIDEYCAKNNIDHIDLLKIDTEGHDLFVIKGAEEMLRRGKIGTITFEVGIFHIFSHLYFYDYHVYLKQFGFTIFKMKALGLEKVLVPENERPPRWANYVAKRV
ncbi:FkbM family methyltransferase [Candidatus Kaiserbacteria bacterium]|nr:FkbM family methyltransferase [Candidatus Kaiserbacteria bacterium]